MREDFLKINTKIDKKNIIERKDCEAFLGVSFHLNA